MKEPHGFTDLRWRFGWRARYIALFVFGPPQLGPKSDPHAKLRRERAERYAGAA